MITLLGEATVEVDLNASYTDAGATAVMPLTVIILMGMLSW